MITMDKKAYVSIGPVCLALFLCASLAACQKPAANPAPRDLAPIKVGKGETPPPALVNNEKDNKSPNIKVKRGKDGSYTWEITGRDVVAILKADRELSKKLGAARAAGKGAGKPDRED
jgi:hypothetical protein